MHIIGKQCLKSACIQTWIHRCIMRREKHFDECFLNGVWVKAPTWKVHLIMIFDANAIQRNHLAFWVKASGRKTWHLARSKCNGSGRWIFRRGEKDGHNACRDSDFMRVKQDGGGWDKLSIGSCFRRNTLRYNSVSSVEFSPFKKTPSAQVKLR